MIDIGVNLSNSRFAKDIPETLRRAQKAGVEKLVLTGTSIEESQAVLELCQNHNEDFSRDALRNSGHSSPRRKQS